MARGTFQGNLQGTPSRPLEMLTSSKAVTASYAETASRLGVNKVGDSGNPVYFNNGIPVADSKTKGIVDWVTNNSGSISGVTGSSADVAVRVNNLEGKSGSWDSSSKWVGDNSASLLNPATLIISKSLGVPSAGNVSYNPFKSASITIAVPSTPGHIGAAPANHTHSTSQVNGLDAFTASVKSDLAEISGKTGSYAPKDDYLPIGGGTITGSLVINNDLTVKGTTVSIDAQNLNVKDKLILVASGSNTRAAADGAGIAVPTASAGEGGAARIQYDGTANVFTSSVGFKAPSFTGSLRGNVTGTASFATSASRAVSAASANTATSASEATHAVSASEAVHAITASHAVNAKTALTASYLENGASIVVNTASYAKTASVAQKVAWTAVDGRPSFYTASFVAGAFSGVQFNPTGGFAQVKVPSTTTHISGLDAVTASVKQMVAKSASWDNVANTASAAYAAASQALATASVAQKEAESASYWKTEASKSAASASTFKITAQTAATQANAASQSAKNAASAANTASGSAKTAATVATNWSLSASNAANIANAASASAQSASNAANVASQSAKTAATVAQGWVTSASKAAQDAEEYRDTASGSMEDARFYSSQAATNATLSSTYAVQSSASAQLAAASASAAASSATNAATYATRAQQSASNAHTSKNLAAASASAAATYATQASQSAYTAAQAVIPATTAANAASASAKNSAASASASAALLYKNLGSKTQPIYLTTGGPALCDPYSSASVKSASYALVAESVKDGAGLTVDRATKLIGTSGSTSLPVWVNAGVPTAITKLADIPVTASTLRATSNLDVAGNAVISGDLTVKGTTTAIDATHLNVKDTLILLASGSTTQAAANGAGIAIQTASATTQAAREGAAARFQYRSSDNKFTASVGIVAPDFTGNLTGTSSYATKATSADSATVATGLGVAGNTSASVAAAIAAKWTYNENTIKAVKVNSASRADSAASATTSTTASYNKAGADALAWVTANSSSALTKYHPLSGTVGTPLVAQNVTSANEFLITGAASVNHYYRVNGSQHHFGFGIGTGNTNRGIYQFSTGSGGVSKIGWLLLWDNTYTASFLSGYRVKADGFIGSLQGNVTGTSSWARNAVSATTASMLQSNSISNPNSASVSHSAVKWFASLAQASGYAGTNYGFPTTNNANGILWLGTHPGCYGHQLGFSSTGRIYDRYISAGSFPTTANGGSWKTILNSDDTASWASATAIVNASASIWSAKGSGNGTVTSVTVTTSSNYVTVDSASAITTTGTRKIDLATKSKNAIDWVIANSGSAATAITNNHTHTNKAVLDGITAAKTASWDTAYGWGNHASAGYVKSSGVTSVTLTTASNYVSVDSAAAITTTGTRKIDLTAATKGKIESGSVAFGWGNHASAGYVKSSGVTSYTLTTSSDYVAVNNAAAVTSTGTRKIDLATKSKNAINWVIANSGSAATAITNNHTHSNKALLDSLTNAKTGSWDGKWTYNENTIKAVKVNSASRADSAASATTATKLAGTSGSTTTPVWINAGVPTACGGTVITDAERKSWVTASNRAQAANDGLTTPLYHSQGEQETVVFRGAFMVVDASGGNITIDLADDEVPSSPNQSVDNYGAGVGVKLSIWGGLILNVVGTVEFVSETGAPFVWSENSVDIETGGTYEFNCIQYENGGNIYGIITKYSES